MRSASRGARRSVDTTTALNPVLHKTVTLKQHLSGHGNTGSKVTNGEHKVDLGIGRSREDAVRSFLESLTRGLSALQAVNHWLFGSGSQGN